ncbi:MAG: 4Fe-4S dicluster domain-containing protein [Deltaproteobacteria bacterium]|nr:4Fe-4S dicluster domain-containing protein [Deltaproteobacteria bacterium]
MTTREILWNIPYGRISIYILAVIALFLFVYGLYRKQYRLYRFWRMGPDENRTDNPWQRLVFLVVNVFGHTRILRETYAGWMHFFMFWGFAILFLGTTLIAIQEDVTILLFDVVFLKGPFYKLFSLSLDIMGLLFLAGVLMAVYRRYIQKPERVNDVLPDDAVTLGLLFAILVTGFGVEGLRIAATELQQNPGLARWSPVGYAVAVMFTGLLGQDALLGLHRFGWWVHALLALGFIAYIPHSRLLHIITSTANVFLHNTAPRGEAPGIPTELFETAETFGVQKVEEFTWKQMFDTEACTRCGRCQDNCPAHLSQKPLSPKKVILDLKEHIHQKAALMLDEKGNPRESTDYEGPDLIGGTIEDEVIWACTTCRACIEACPVCIEPMTKLLPMRQYMVLVESRFPQEVVNVFRNMENNGNPWGIGLSQRAEWAKGLEISTFSEKPDAEYLFFPGCAGAYDDRNKKVARALARLMNNAGVDFAILGPEETCCGDSARRIGNDYLYATLVQMNVEVFTSYNIRKIITMCPHGFNTFTHEYPRYGGHYEVIHHTQLLSRLLAEGKIRPTRQLDGERIVYHDSCYLGRYNEIYNEPRAVLQAISGVELREMPRRCEKSFCCGAGGGRMWMEESIGRRINHIRTQEAMETGASTVSTACPFCLTMLEDGIKELGEEESMKARDIIELLEPSL